MTLILAVGILAILTIVSTTMISYTSQSARHAGYQRSEDVTIDLAEAGLARALSKLAAAGNALAPTLLDPGETYVLDGGSVTVSGLLAGETWNITSKSTVTNPAGGADLHKTLTMQVQIGIDPSANNAWNYVYSDAPESGGCMVLKNSVVIASPLFVKGDLCLQNTARAEGSMVKVGGDIYITNSASIGDPGTSPITYVPELKTGQGCKTSSGGTPNVSNCTTANRYWATATSTDPGVLEKPNVDFSYWYSYSRPGPSYDCTTSTGNIPKPSGHTTMFDRDTTLDRDRDAFDPLQANPYSCEVWEGANMLGKISWTPDNGDADAYGELQVIGTVFFDGDVNFTSGRKAVYTGRGTIYASGKITFSGTTYVCGTMNCDLNAWNTEQNLLVLVSGYCNDVVLSCDYGDRNVLGFDMNNSSIFQGAVYAVGNFEQSNTGQMQGPVIAHQLTFENTGIANKWVAIEAMTMGTPGAGRKLNILTTGF